MGAPFRRSRERVVAMLDRGDRRLLSLIGSGYMSVRYRQPCVLSYDDGAWIHRYRDAVVIGSEIGEWPLAVLASHVSDYFLWEYRPRPGDTVLDVGAGVGGETLVCSGLVGDAGRIVAIEAHPRTFAWLEAMCVRNRLTNVKCLNAAAADRPGTLLISDDENHLANTLIGTGAGVSVPALTLDQIATATGVERVALLKMNIEGAERPALEGIGDLLARTDHVAIACHDFLATDGPDDPLRTSAFVREHLRDAGFEVTNRPSHPDPWVRDTLYGRRV
jgi:FkbM family methyltransferase